MIANMSVSSVWTLLMLYACLDHSLFPLSAFPDLMLFVCGAFYHEEITKKDLYSQKINKQAHYNKKERKKTMQNHLETKEKSYRNNMEGFVFTENKRMNKPTIARKNTMQNHLEIKERSYRNTIV